MRTATSVTITLLPLDIAFYVPIIAIHLFTSREITLFGRIELYREIVRLPHSVHCEDLGSPCIRNYTRSLPQLPGPGQISICRSCMYGGIEPAPCV